MEPVTGTPFYTDWTFWAVFISFVALALSQLPPVHLIFKAAKIDLETYSRIYLTHKVGNPNLQLHLIISNIGGRSVKILGSKMDLYRDEKLITSLVAQNYLQDPKDRSPILLTRFLIKPNEEWGHLVNYFISFNREEEKIYRDAENALRTDILKQGKPEDSLDLVEADSFLVEPLLKMFDEKFIFSPGEYEMVVKIETDNQSTNLEYKYRFIVFESDTSVLKSYKDDYKYGDGIYWNSTKHLGIGVPINKI